MHAQNFIRSTGGCCKFAKPNRASVGGQDNMRVADFIKTGKDIGFYGTVFNCGFNYEISSGKSREIFFKADAADNSVFILFLNFAKLNRTG